MIDLVAGVQEREIYEDVAHEEHHLQHVLGHVAIVGGQNDVAGDGGEEMTRYYQTEAGFLLNSLRSELQLEMDETREAFLAFNVVIGGSSSPGHRIATITCVNCRNANWIRQKADVMHGYPMSHMISPMTLGIVSLRLYESMNRQAALDTPSIHRNILMVVMNGRLDMRDLKMEKRLHEGHENGERNERSSK